MEDVTTQVLPLAVRSSGITSCQKQLYSSPNLSLHLPQCISAPAGRPHIVKAVWSAFVGRSRVVASHESPQQLNHFFTKLLQNIRPADSQVVPLLRIESDVEQMFLQFGPRRVEHLNGTLTDVPTGRPVRPVSVFAVETG